MIDFSLPCWKEAHNWIIKQREKGKDWDFIQFGGKKDVDGLRQFLENHIDDWDEIEQLSSDIWFELVEYAKKEDSRLKDVEFNCGQGMVELVGENNGFKHVPTDPKSAWQLYRKHLIENKGFDEDKVKLMESHSWRVLQKLSLDTTTTPPVRGMVVGNVQSGKTANMAALMAMAADYGWNMFIVLSGTIENLRLQTYERLNQDLKSGQITWHPLGGQLGPKSEPQAQALSFENNQVRYYTVCLKNSNRLANLLKWLLADPHKPQHMKLLIIDDEADQAGVNTAPLQKERSSINRQLCNLVNNYTAKGEDNEAKYQAVNYVGYTATPYANFLNEIGKDQKGRLSLYPENFVATIAVSKEYFGPQQIFGLEGKSYSVHYDGLDIVREVSKNCVEQVKEIHNGGKQSLPEDLQDAILWFLCSAACYRFWDYQGRVSRKPISMLIHTSQNTSHHQKVYDAIQKWLTCRVQKCEAFLNDCEILWKKETARFSLKAFAEQYHDYALLKDMSSMNDYPCFDSIKPHLEKLIGIAPSHILFSSEDEKKEYHEGIHFCVDNCMNNKITDEGEFVRLAYPDKETMEKIAFSPAFIVIGGATLSRGLTIEGLVSTFFLRSVGQADTLMQMGRWFGYRKGYELLPRLWLTNSTRQQFEFLAELDQELRDEVIRLDSSSLVPAQVGVKVKNTPKKKFIRIAAPNKMKSAEEASWDYSGVFKETYRFPRNEKLLNDNLKNTKIFIEKINSISKPEQKKMYHPFVWRDVEFGLIKNFLQKFNYGKRIQPFNQIEQFCSWIDECHQKEVFKNWNVVLAGLRNPTDDDIAKKKWDFSFGSLIKVNRSKKISDDPEDINIGYLSATQDILVDIPEADDAFPDLSNESDNAVKAVKRRELAGQGDRPQLIVYCVDANSKYLGKDPNNKGFRSDLDAPADLIGLCVLIPGYREAQSSYASTLKIKLPNYETDEFGNSIE